MRIIAGQWRSRRLEPPADPRVRPTTDRVREAWMNVVADRLQGARVVDLFAGTGAMGLEALSRGAAHCDFVELDPRSLAALGRNIETLGAAHDEFSRYMVEVCLACSWNYLRRMSLLGRRHAG